MSRCSVNTCREQNKLTLFAIPNEPKIREKWLDFLKLSGKVVNDNSSYKICEIHFSPMCIKQNNVRKFLIAGSVPSILSQEVS